MLVISPKAKISPFADIEDFVRGSEIVIEEGGVIDAFVKIKPAGGMENVRIGASTYINSGCVIYTGNGIDIGRHVLIAANYTFAPTNHEYRRRGRLIVEQRFMPSHGGIVVGDDVWIGANCVILDGAHIAQGCVLGALSLVRGQLEPYSVYAGNPLQRIGKRV